MTPELLKILPRLFRSCVQIQGDLKIHRSIADDGLPHFSKRIIEQTFLLLKNGITAKEYYLQRLWRQGMLDTEKEAFLGFFGRRRWQRAVNPLASMDLMDNKLLFFLYASAVGIPTPRIICAISQETLKISLPVFRNWKDLETWLVNGRENIFIKPIKGSNGSGVLSLGHRYDFPEPAWQMLPKGGDITLSEIQNHILSKANSEFVFQDRLEPSVDMSPFAEGVLHSLRIVTIRKDNKAHILAAVSKIGTGFSPIDNFIGGKNLIAPVDLREGQLGSAVYLKEDLPIRVDRHPVTDVRITGFRLKEWSKILSTVLNASEKFPWFHIIGWDVGLTKEGPIIIEANHSPEMLLIQLAHDRGLLDWPEFRDFFFKRKLQRKIGLGIFPLRARF